MTWIVTCTIALALLAPVELVYAGGAPKPVVRDEMHELTATVESIDPASRTLVLMGAQGNRVVVAAGPEVHNFNRIKVGDHLTVGFYVGLAIAVKPPGQGVRGVEESVATARAPAGQPPAGGIGRSITTTVKIDSVDTSFNTVTFKRHDGIVRTLAVEDPEAQAFIHRLKPGDEVEIVYTEAIAVSVQPASH